MEIFDHPLNLYADGSALKLVHEIHSQFKATTTRITIIWVRVSRRFVFTVFLFSHLLKNEITITSRFDADFPNSSYYHQDNKYPFSAGEKEIDKTLTKTHPSFRLVGKDLRLQHPIPVHN
jgi:hypothetical protein